MYSHEQLINAVRAAGREGRTFSVKDVRTQLGFETRDKKELSRFRRRLRAFEKEVGDQLEKVGNNSYRLKAGAFETGAVGALVTTKKDVREPASGVFETLPTVAEVGAVATAPETPAPLQPSAAEPTAHAAATPPSIPVVQSAPQPPEEPVAQIAEQPAPAIAARVAKQPTAAAAHVAARVADEPTGAARVAEQPTAAAARVGEQPIAAAARVAEQPIAAAARVAEQPAAARVAEQPIAAAAPTHHISAQVTEQAMAATAPVTEQQTATAARVAEQPTAAAARVAERPTAAPARVAERPSAAHAVAAAPAERSGTNGAPKAAAVAVQQPAANGVKVQPVAAYAPPPSASVPAPAQSAKHSVGRVQRAKQLATTILSGALAASAAVSGRVRQRSHNLREQLWSCIRAVPTRQHAIARLRGWAEGLRPLSSQVRHQLNVLRQRVRRA